MRVTEIRFYQGHRGVPDVDVGSPAERIRKIREAREYLIDGIIGDGVSQFGEIRAGVF